MKTVRGEISFVEDTLVPNAHEKSSLWTLLTVCILSADAFALKSYSNWCSDFKNLDNRTFFGGSRFEYSMTSSWHLCSMDECGRSSKSCFCKISWLNWELNARGSEWDHINKDSSKFPSVSVGIGTSIIDWRSRLLQITSLKNPSPWGRGFKALFDKRDKKYESSV